MRSIRYGMTAVNNNAKHKKPIRMCDSMEYKFNCDVKATDLWKISMSRTYRSFLGVINIVFTVSMIAMTIKLWPDSGEFSRALEILCCLIFPVFQPLAILGRSYKQLEQQPKGVELTFRNTGILVTCGDKEQRISWSRVTRVIRQSSMIVIKTDDSYGYMIMNRAMGEEKDAFYDYLVAQLKQQKK